MQFVKRHWRGDLPLGVSVVAIFICLSLAYHFVQPLLFERWYDQTRTYVLGSALYVFLTSAIVFPWQLRGLLRALDRHFLRHDNHLVLYGVQAIAIGGLILTVSMAIGNAQELVYYWEKKEFEKNNQASSFVLSISPDGKYLQLEGVLDFGITGTAADYLERYPDVEAVMLDSIGGQIYEGRGLARLFQQHALDTYTFSECSSSCTTAFIGGAQRYLGTGAKLGFHQYAIDQDRQRQTTAVYDLQQEQTKDIAFFKSQGVQDNFLDKVFDTPEHSMWYPDSALLMSAGVIHAIVD